MFGLNVNKPTLSRLALIILIGFFLLSHFYFALMYETPGSDTYIYGTYALAWRQSLSNNQTVYEINEKPIEYPPLSVLWMSLPVIFINQPTFVSSEILAHNPALVDWHSIFKFFYWLFDVFIFLIILWFFIKPHKFLKIDSPNLILFIILGLLLLNFLYDRLDFYLAGLIFLSLVALISHTTYWLSFFLLAIAINFKLIPIFLAPIFLIGSLPLSYLKNFSNNFFHYQWWLALFKRGLILIILTAVIFLPFYLYDPNHALDFFAYHQNRGLQLESFFSSLLLIGAWFKVPMHVYHDFGAYNLQAPGANFLAQFSFALICFLVLGLAVWLLFAFKKIATNSNSFSFGAAHNLAQFQPQIFLKLVIIVLLVVMIFSKVLSPQYLLWLVPLAPLLSVKNKNNILAIIFFIFSLFLTNLIYPYLYSYFIHDQILLASGITIWGVPATSAIIVLLARNILLIITTLILVKNIVSDLKNINNFSSQ